MRLFALILFLALIFFPATTFAGQGSPISVLLSKKNPTRLDEEELRRKFLEFYERILSEMPFPDPSSKGVEKFLEMQNISLKLSKEIDSTAIDLKEFYVWIESDRNFQISLVRNSLEKIISSLQAIDLKESSPQEKVNSWLRYISVQSNPVTITSLAASQAFMPKNFNINPFGTDMPISGWSLLELQSVYLVIANLLIENYMLTSSKD